MRPGDTGLDLDDLADRLAERLAPLLRHDPEQLLDRPALAVRLGVAERTIGALVARAELPPPLLHTGGLARWSWGEVVKHLAARRGRRLRKGRGRHPRTGKDRGPLPAPREAGGAS
jgi:hypothetical protein